MPPRKKTQKQLVPVGSIQPPTEFKGEYNQSELDKRNLNGLGSVEDAVISNDSVPKVSEVSEISEDHLVVDNAHLNDKIEELAENLTESQQMEIVPYLEKEVAKAVEESVKNVPIKSKKSRAPRKTKKQLEKELLETNDSLPVVGTKEHQKKVKKIQKDVKKVVKSKNMSKEQKIKLIRELEKELHGMLKDYKKMRGQILKLRVSAMIARRLIVKEEVLINDEIIKGPKTRLRPRKSKLPALESKIPLSATSRQQQIKNLQSIGWSYRDAIKILKGKRTEYEHKFKI